jgi:DHA1 family bicyclomycin/chloramphenicol resistance-like MFS transporter
VAGPLSDRPGRRRPPFAGLVTYAGVSLLCSLAPNVTALTGLRFLQGLAGGSGIVIGRAVCPRPLLGRGRGAAVLLADAGHRPRPDPRAVIGAQVLKLTAWQGIFVAISSPYRLVVDSTRVPLETCVDLIAGAVRR